jgi:hypothetical protein
MNEADSIRLPKQVDHRLIPTDPVTIMEIPDRILTEAEASNGVLLSSELT